MTKGWKTSEFWTHIAVVAGSIASASGTIFDHTFVTNHPIVAAGIGIAAGVATAVSQAAYTIGRSMVKTTQPAG